MLDTGIDVPEVVNLVFFKMVRSKTKFWQMLGRGTRLCPDLFGPGQDKQFFYIFDYCQNLEFFSENPDQAAAPAGEPLSTRLFRARLALIGELDRQPLESGQAAEPKAGYGSLRGELADLLHAQVAAMNIDNFVVRPQRQSVEKFANRDAWRQLSGEDFHELAENLAGLPSEFMDEDEEAKRFDMFVLRAQLTILQAQPCFPVIEEGFKRLPPPWKRKPAFRTSMRKWC